MRVIPWLLTVAGAIWTTGNLVALIVAFAAFAWAPPQAEVISRAGAGAVFGLVLERWSGWVVVPLFMALLALGWIAGSAWRVKRPATAAAWILAMAVIWAVHAVNHQTVVEANQLAGRLRAAPAANTAEAAAGGDLERRFAELHRRSERWHVAETLLALGLFAGGSILALRQGGRARPVGPATSPAPVTG